MSKVLLVGLEKDKDKILRAIQDEGVLEVSEAAIPPEMQEGSSPVTGAAAGERIEALEREHAEVLFALRFLDLRSEEKRPKPGRIRESELEAVLSARQEYLEMAAACREIETRENELESRRHNLLNMREKYLPWLGLDVPVESLRDTDSVLVRAGSVSKSAALAFEHDLQEAGLVFMKKVGEERDSVSCFLAFHRSVRSRVGEILRRYSFVAAGFGEATGTPREIVAEYERQIEGLREEKKTLHEEAAGMAEPLPRLQMLADALGMELDRLHAANRAVNTQNAFAIRGWVRTRDEERLREVVGRAAGAFHLEYTAPEPGEPFPVYTENPGAVTPFEMVTNLYSVPASDGIDPNKVVAPFHAAFLGLMMADVGYGIILAAGGFLFRRNAEGGARKLGGVIMYSGIMAVIWGLLLGSYFGDLGERFGIPAFLINPMDNPVEMMMLCLGLGAFHLLFGLGVKAYMLIRKQQYLAALFDVGFWYCLLLGLPLMITPYADLGTGLALVGAVGLVATQGRSKKGFFGKLIGGLGSLYGIAGYLSDVLSYSRLFALLLSTAVVGMVMNQIAAMAGTGIVGYIAAALIFVVGHSFNLFIGGLGAFVHGSRLIYVEFFSKFFVGGGHAFDPLTKKTKFVKLDKKEAA